MSLYAGFDNVSKTNTFYNNVVLSPNSLTPTKVTQIFGVNDSQIFPTFSWNANSNTGMFSPLNNNLALTTNSLERLRIDNNGNVGIGTTVANALMSINGNTAGGDIVIINQSGFGDIIEMRSANNPVVTVRSTGGVGIGTTNPQAKLHINNPLGTYNFIGLPAISMLEERYTSGTSGTNLPSSTWTNRSLNTVIFDSIGVNLTNPNTSFSPSRATFTLPIGTYLIQADFNGNSVTAHKIRLYNLTATRDEAYSINEASTNSSVTSANQCSTRASLTTVISVNSSTIYTIDHFVASTNSVGSGRAMTITGVPEIYGRVIITKYQ